jgi:hypothetical protein
MSAVLPGYLHYYAEYGLIICATHQTALYDTKIVDHITKLHGDIHFTQANLSGFDIMPLHTVHHLIMEKHPIEPFSTLQPPQNGFECKICKSLRLTQRKIRDHLNQSHGIIGYQAQDTEATLCPIQALEGSAYLFKIAEARLSAPATLARKRSRELSLSSSAIPSSQYPRQRLAGHTQTPEALSNSFLAQFTSLRTSLKASRVIQPLAETYEARGFFTDSQYPSFLAGRDAAELEALFTLDSPDNMTWLSTIVHCLLSQGNNMIQSTSVQTLGTLNSFSSDPVIQATLHPLRSLQNQATLQRYSRVFLAFLYFLLHSYTSIKGSGPASYKGLYSLTSRQLESLVSLQNFLQALPSPSTALATAPLATAPLATTPLATEPNELSDLSSESDSEAETSLSTLPEASLDHINMAKAIGLVKDLALSLAECEAPNRQKNPLYAFLACFSRNYTRDCFKPLTQISGAYSAMIRSFQLIILYWIHTDLYSNNNIEISMAKLVKQWMEQWFIAQSETTLGHMLVLRALAFSVLKSSTSLGKIYALAPHILRCEYITLSQQDLRVFLAKGIPRLAQSLSNDLFLDFGNFIEVYYLSLSLYLFKIITNIYIDPKYPLSLRSCWL